ncbi:unnamed protein product [Gongylonema pulchrum]|uniref:Laminin N-terminal domain-containing protein n=1 Tax=Gongylonema pulchrum TaxID=637853 RepID=A0A183DTG4_9BILA|nr:unnamed protein product [Gongylonema pulchrum]
MLVSVAVLVLFRMYSSYAAYFSQFSLREPDHDPCYDSVGRPVRCIPDFINAAFGKPVTASNTCGQSGPTRYALVSSPFVKVDISIIFWNKQVCRKISALQNKVVSVLEAEPSRRDLLTSLDFSFFKVLLNSISSRYDNFKKKLMANVKFKDRLLGHQSSGKIPVGYEKS